MSQDPKQNDPAGEQGQSLMVILMLGAILAFFGTVLTRMLVREAANIVKSKSRDRIFTAGDAAMERSMSVLLGNDNLWSSPNNISGYASLTVTGYTDVPGVTYYIKITAGAYVDDGNTGAATDWNLSRWTQTGSLLNDRTIFVRTVDIRGKEDRFFTTIHRTDAPPYLYGGDALAASGFADVGSKWVGDVYNSCNGPYGGSGDLPNSEGSVTTGSGTNGNDGQFATGGNWNGFGLNNGTAPAYPAIAAPAGTIGTYTSSAYTSQNPTNAALSGATIWLRNSVDGSTVNYEASSFTGNGTINVTGPGQVALWLTAASGSSFEMSGSSTVNVNTNGSTQCCLAKMFTVYVTQVDDPNEQPSNSCGDCSIRWVGTPAATFLLVGPKANMEYKGGGHNNFTGAIAVQNLLTPPSSGTSMIYDACLKTKPPVDNYSAPPVLTTSWQQIGFKNSDFK